MDTIAETSGRFGAKLVQYLCQIQHPEIARPGSACRACVLQYMNLRELLIEDLVVATAYAANPEIQLDRFVHIFEVLAEQLEARVYERYQVNELLRSVSGVSHD